MKKIETFLTFTISLLLCAISFAQEQVPAPVNYWRFKAATKSSTTSSSDRLNGEYEVIASGTKLQVFQIADGQRMPVGPTSEAELKRMVLIGQDERQYVKVPLEKKWKASYSYYPPGVTRAVSRIVEYNVLGQGETTTAAGTFRTSKVEGATKVYSPIGIYDQKWIYEYGEAANAIVKWYYDSGVGRDSGKIEIELIKFGSTSGESK